MLPGFALGALDDALFPRLTEDFLVGIAGRTGRSKTIGEREGVVVPVLEGQDGIAISCAELSLVAGTNE